jgi:hypothetical protein
MNFIGNQYIPASRFGMTIHRFSARKYFVNSDITAEYDYFHQYQCGPQPCVSDYPRAYNINYRYYLTDNLTLVTGYDAYYKLYSDKYGVRQSAEWAARGITVNPAAFYSETKSIGLNYMVGNFAYKAEFHKVKGSNAAIASQNNVLNPNLPPKYNIWMLNVTYSF